MSDDGRRDYQRERERAKLRADGSFPSLLVWGAIGLLTVAGGGAILYSILMSIH